MHHELSHPLCIHHDCLHISIYISPFASRTTTSFSFTILSSSSISPLFFISVDLDYNQDTNTISHTHNIVFGATKSDCETCFDSMEVKTLPVATYSPDKLYRTRLGSVGMVNGPSLLRSGAMATELALTHGDGRVRVIFQHAPVWEAGIEPGSCPPQGLKLFRTMVSREALRDSPPTPESEATTPPDGNDNPVFFRGVPPFKWHKKWGGTSWTWGPNSGDRGWRLDQMEEVDAWHGRPTGDDDNVWNLRLPGGILLQGPRVVVDGEAGICRLAWLANDDTLLRMEAGVLALEPMIAKEDDAMVGFHPPSLGSLRCDVLKNLGDLDDVARFVGKEEGDELRPRSEAEINASKSSAAGQDVDGEGSGSGLGAIRDAMGP